MTTNAAAVATPPPTPPAALLNDSTTTTISSIAVETSDTASTSSTSNTTTVAVHSGREARNLAEKHRRDKLNASIQELATMVPHVADSPRRMDKTAVLRFAAHGLRLQYVFGKSVVKNCRQRKLHGLDVAEGLPNSHEESEEGEEEALQQPQITDTLLQLVDGFFLTLTCHGQIVLISTSVEQLLGHCQSDLYGQNILQVTHPEDQDTLRQQLIPHDMESLFRNDYHHAEGPRISEGDHDDEEDGDELADDEDDVNDEHHHDTNTNTDTACCRTPSPRTKAYFEDVDRRLRNDRRCFMVRLARAGTRSEATRRYELVKIDGCFRRSDHSASAGTFPIMSQLIKRSRSSSSAGLAGINHLQHDAFVQAALHGISGNDIVFVAVARIIRAPKVMAPIYANKLEYRTRHLIDGCIVDCDQRIGLVAGYMQNEVRNLSAFSFIHQDDYRWVVLALRRMYDCASEYGESYYRLLTRNGNFIYLQTRGSFEIDNTKKEVHTFVCVNTLLDEEEGKRKVQEMKDKLSIIIKPKNTNNSLQDVPASQNPQQLERTVLYLIENLQTHTDSDELQSISDGVATTSAQGGAAPNQNDNQSKHQPHRAITPSLSLVPPKPASVRNSISKAVNAINVTVVKNLQCNLKSPSGASLQSNSDSSLSPTSSLDQVEMEQMVMVDEQMKSRQQQQQQQHPVAMQRPSVLQMRLLGTKTKASTASAAVASSGIVQRTTTTTDKSVITINNLNSRGAVRNGVGNTIITTLQTTTTTNQQQQHQQQQQMLQQQISVLKRLHSPTTTTGCIIKDEIEENANDYDIELNHNLQSPAKRRNAFSYATTATTSAVPTEVHTVLSSSLNSLDQNLLTIGQNVRLLRQQHTRLLPPTSSASTTATSLAMPTTVMLPNTFDDRLDALIEEHQKQKTILVNIQSEYGMHMQQQQQQQQQQLHQQQQLNYQQQQHQLQLQQLHYQHKQQQAEQQQLQYSQSLILNTNNINNGNNSSPSPNYTNNKWLPNVSLPSPSTSPTITAAIAPALGAPPLSTSRKQNL